MGKYFGTDGFRGKAGVTVTADAAYAIGRFLGYELGKSGKKPKILIGKDTRLSSSMLEAAVTAGIAASGGDCVLSGVISTPAVSFLTRTEGFDIGIMISASHNPYFDNGIKLMNEKGEKADDDLIGKIEEALDRPPVIPFASEKEIGCVRAAPKLLTRYLAFLKETVHCRFDGLKVGLDCANGAASVSAKKLFSDLGAEVTAIADEPDGIRINDACGSTHTERLRSLVREKHLDVGFAFDGDADRCIAVDENGNEKNGDALLYLLAADGRARGTLKSGKIVATVMSNVGLLRALEAAGIGYEICDVGDRFVYERMKEGGHTLGGEESGHLIFSDHETTGDGLLTAALALRVLKESDRPFSALTAPVVFYPQRQKSVPVADKDAALSHPLVQKTLAEQSEKLGKTGKVLLRKSGTEPVLRVMVQAPTASACEAAVEEITRAIVSISHRVGVLS